MSCCQTVSQPRLAYSIVSCSTDWFDNPVEKIRKLRDHGFCVLTIVVEYPVHARRGRPATQTVNGWRYDNIPSITIIAENDPKFVYTPSLASIQALITAAFEQGMHVQLVPHVDAIDVTSYIWRANFLFDPMASYKTRIIDPLLGVLINALNTVRVNGDADCKPCADFTLGSEVDMSLAAYGSRWDALYAHVSGRRTAELGANAHRLEFGHKINHDFVTSLASRVTAAKRMYPTVVANTGPARTAALAYLARLDYIAVSFYPNLGNAAQWRNAPDIGNFTALSARIAENFRRIKREIFAALPTPPANEKRPCVDIGEAGIGWTDTTQPASEFKHKPAAPGTDPNKSMPDFTDINLGLRTYQNIRCNYYGALLWYMWSHPEDFAAANCKGNCPGDFRSVALWNNHWQYDVIGLIIEQEPAAKRADYRRAFVDDKIGNFFKIYNSGNNAGLRYLGGRRFRFSGGGCLLAPFILLQSILLFFVSLFEIGLRRINQLFHRAALPGSIRQIDEGIRSPIAPIMDTEIEAEEEPVE